MTRRLRRLIPALTACLDEKAWERPPLELRRAIRLGNLPALADLARAHGVGNFLYVAIRNVRSANPDVLEDLEAAYSQSVAFHLQAIADVDWVGRLLDRHAVRWLVVKGPVLSEIFYPRSDLRAYRDLDVVVPRHQFVESLRLLESNGAELLDRNWSYAHRVRVGQLHFRLRLGTPTDLHWHLLNAGRARDSFSVPMTDLFERSVPMRLGQTAIRTLDPVDSLLQVALHGALHGGTRLLWLKDVERAIVAGAPSWQTVVERASEWRCSVPVGIVLLRARRSIAAPVPISVIESLLDSRIRRRVTSVVDSVSPPETSFRRSALSVLWGRTAKDRWLATLSSMGRHVRDSVVFPLNGQTRQDRNDPFRESGGSKLQEAYLRYVASTDDVSTTASR